MHIFGKQQASFLRTGGAQVKPLTTERPKKLFSTIGIGALDAGYSLGVIPAADEVMDDFGNPFDPEPPIGF